MRFSASRISTWSNCQLQSYFHYHLQLPEKQGAKQSFGTIIHKVLENYNHHADLQQAIVEFRDLWDNPEKLGVTPEVWPKMTTFGGLRKRGVEILEAYEASLHWDKREVIATEHPFLVPFGEHELAGFVDLLELRKSGTGKELLKVVDYKTSSYRPNMAELHLNLQFTVYAYAVLQREFWVGNGDGFPPIPNGEWRFETLKDIPRRNIWYHLWTNKEIDAGTRTQADFDRLYRVALEIDRADRLDVHVPNIGQACQWCSFVKECEVSIPTKESLSNDENVWI